jgi:hypothetical protein
VGSDLTSATFALATRKSEIVALAAAEHEDHGAPLPGDLPAQSCANHMTERVDAIRLRRS